MAGDRDIEALVELIASKVEARLGGRTSLPVVVISLLPGFEEPNSFYRAFRRLDGNDAGRRAPMGFALPTPSTSKTLSQRASVGLRRRPMLTRRR